MFYGERLAGISGGGGNVLQGPVHKILSAHLQSCFSGANECVSVVGTSLGTRDRPASNFFESRLPQSQYIANWP
jgi:hypothetical protein